MATISEHAVGERLVAALGRVLPIALPLAAAYWYAERPAWQFMWVVAVAMYFGFKCLTLIDGLQNARPSAGRALGYFFLWPGMDARRFFSQRRVSRPRIWSWIAALGNLAFGFALLYLLAPWALRASRLLGGWIGMAGILFVLHFGVGDLSTLAWRRAGVDASRIMRAPILAQSLSEFWGRRWNLAFRDLSHRFAFQPLRGKMGLGPATLTVFLLSGLLHDAVISSAAGAGYGLPTAYFVIQGAGLLLERSAMGKRWRLGHGWRGRFYGALVTALPAGLLFHPPFVDRVVIPTLEALGTLQMGTIAFSS